MLHPDSSLLTPDSSLLTPYSSSILMQRIRPTEAVAARRDRAWLWEGYLAPGMVTLLTSQWKSGKTTLISILLARMAAGGKLAGLPVKAGQAAVISEEQLDDWAARCRKLNIGDHVSLFCRPFYTKPEPAQWQGLLDAMLELRRTEGLDLVVIDSLSVFLPGQNENSAGVVTKNLLPLSALTAQGLSVLLVHHPRKGAITSGQAARGSGALASFVDILLEKSWYGDPKDTNRRRWLRGYSRHAETPRHVILELTPAADDYVLHENAMDETSAECERVLRMVLEDAWERMTQRQILEEWPEDFHKPNVTTVGRALGRGLKDGSVLRAGTGRRDDPYRYSLPGKEADFRPGPGASPEEMERWGDRMRAKVHEALGWAPPTEEEQREEKALQEARNAQLQSARMRDKEQVAQREQASAAEAPPP